MKIYWQEGECSNGLGEKRKSWRPKGWDANKIAYQKIPEEGLISVALVEAGADAMLEVLRANQWCQGDLSVLKANFRGKVVIIPDDEEVKS